MFLLALIYSLWAFGEPGSVSYDQLSKVDRLINAEIELVKKRIIILEKAYAQLDSVMRSSSARAQKAAANFAKTKFEDDKALLANRLSNLQKIKKSYEDRALTGNGAVQALSHGSSGCDYTECLGLLGSVNKDLANSISSITTEVLIQDWDKFYLAESQSMDLGIDISNDDPLNEFSKLYFKNWACQRSLSKATIPFKIQGQKLGHCFVSILAEVSKKKRTPMRISTDAPNVLPENKNLRPYGAKHARITEKIMNSPDYQMTPWKLFEECANLENASLKEASLLCYETLRYNRLRPDLKRKFIDIRGDRNQGGDNIGDWYHMFGMIYVALQFGGLTKALYWLHPYMALGTEAQLLEFQKIDIKEISSDLLGIDIGLAAERRLKNILGPIPVPPGQSKDECNNKKIFITEK